MKPMPVTPVTQILEAFAIAESTLATDPDCDRDETHTACHEPFRLAEELLNWSWEEDEPFASYCGKSTQEEILAAGRIRVGEVAQAQTV